MSSAVCAVCGSAEFGDPQDGLFFCLECGTQSQDVREELSQLESGGGKFTRTLKSKKKKHNKWTDSEQSGHPMAIFQQVLKRQCEAMMTLGFDPSLKDAVRLIWFTYLRHYGYAFRIPGQSISGGWKRKCMGQHPSSYEHPSSHGGGSSDSNSGSQTAFSTSGGRKRRASNNDNSKAKKAKLSGQEISEYDTFPDDKFLFQSSQQTFEDTGETSQVKDRQLTVETISSSSEVMDVSECRSIMESISDWSELEEIEKGMNCRQLLAFRHAYLNFRCKKYVPNDELSKDQPRLFTMHMTVSVIYLALLYSQQPVLPADLVRWVQREKIPLNTPLEPVDETEKQDQSLFLSTKYVLTTSSLLENAFRLYLYLPLPPIPRPDPHTICHFILDKLKLTDCFKKLVDRALDSVYKPVGFSRQLKMDSECAAVIIMMLKLLYGLDDHTELTERPHVSSLSGVDDGEGEELTSANSLPVWVDWVQLYCTQVSSEEDIPVNLTDLNWTKNHHYYLQFCRETVFIKCRNNPSSSKTVRKFELGFSKKISSILGSVRKIKATSTPPPSSLDESQVLSSSPSLFSQDIPGSGTHSEEGGGFPRLVHISHFVEDSKAPCTTYRCLPDSHLRSEELDQNHLSHAMRFVISVLCQVIDTTPGNLFTLLLSVERAFSKGTLVTLQNLTDVLVTTH